MSIYEQLVCEAYTKVRFLYEDYKEDKKPVGMYGLLVGDIDGFAVKANADAPHNYQAVIDAVHKFFDNKKDSDIIEFYKSGIFMIIEYVVPADFLQGVINILSYEMLKEEDGTATFSIGIEEILAELSKVISDSYDELLSKNSDFEKWLKEQNSIMYSEYGYRLVMRDDFSK